MTGGSVNDTINTKYPKAAAIYKSGGYTPDEFYNVGVLAGDGRREHHRRDFRRGGRQGEHRILHCEQGEDRRSHEQDEVSGPITTS